MGNVTVTTAANLIPEVWGPVLLKEYVAAQKFRRLVTDLEFQGEPGDTIHVPIISALEAEDKTKGTDLTPDANTESKVDVLIDKHKAKLVTIEKLAKVQADFSLMQIYAAEIGQALGRAIDSDIAALVASAGSTIDATATLPANLHLKVLEAKVALDAANAPENDRVLAVTPQFAGELMQNPYFISKDYVGDAEAVRSGVIGMIYGFLVVMSNALPASGGTDSNFVFCRSAVALAVQSDIQLTATPHARGIATDVVGDVIYGVKVLQSAGTIELTSATAGYDG